MRHVAIQGWPAFAQQAVDPIHQFEGSHRLSKVNKHGLARDDDLHMWMRGLVYKLPLAGGGRDNEWFHSIGIKHRIVTLIEARRGGYEDVLLFP